jgi:CheY-like chemotaxis protein
VLIEEAVDIMKRVLLVDDDQIFNFLSSKILQKIGIAGEVQTALNGRAALDLINSGYEESAASPDLILLDLNMPIMDGFGFLEAFKNLSIPNKDQIRVVVVSSSQDPRDIQRARDLGVTRYLSKPLTEHSLRAILEEN